MQLTELDSTSPDSNANQCSKTALPSIADEYGQEAWHCAALRQCCLFATLHKHEQRKAGAKMRLGHTGAISDVVGKSHWHAEWGQTALIAPVVLDQLIRDAAASVC